MFLHLLEKFLVVKVRGIPSSRHLKTYENVKAVLKHVGHFDQNSQKRHWLKPQSGKLKL
jgi:hypothetical protein